MVLRSVPISPMWLIVILCISQNSAFLWLRYWALSIGIKGWWVSFVCLFVWVVFGSIKAGLSSSQWIAPDCDRRMSLWAKFCWEILVWRIPSFYWLLARGFQPLLLTSHWEYSLRMNDGGTQSHTPSIVLRWMAVLKWAGMSREANFMSLI